MCFPHSTYIERPLCVFHTLPTLRSHFAFSILPTKKFMSCEADVEVIERVDRGGRIYSGNDTYDLRKLARITDPLTLGFVQ